MASSQLRRTKQFRESSIARQRGTGRKTKAPADCSCGESASRNTGETQPLRQEPAVARLRHPAFAGTPSRGVCFPRLPSRSSCPRRGALSPALRPFFGFHTISLRTILHAPGLRPSTPGANSKYQTRIGCYPGESSFQGNNLSSRGANANVGVSGVSTVLPGYLMALARVIEAQLKRPIFGIAGSRVRFWYSLSSRNDP